MSSKGEISDGEEPSQEPTEEESKQIEEDPQSLMDRYTKQSRKRGRDQAISSTTNETSHVVADTPTTHRSKRLRPNLDPVNVQLVTQTLSRLFKNKRTDEVTTEELSSELEVNNHSITKGELDRILSHLNETNKIFLHGQSIHI